MNLIKIAQRKAVEVMFDSNMTLLSTFKTVEQADFEKERHSPLSAATNAIQRPWTDNSGSLRFSRVILYIQEFCIYILCRQ